MSFVNIIVPTDCHDDSAMGTFSLSKGIKLDGGKLSPMHIVLSASPTITQDHQGGYNPSTQDAEVVGSGVQSQPKLHVRFETHLGYMRLCLKHASNNDKKHLQRLATGVLDPENA